MLNLFKRSSSLKFLSKTVSFRLFSAVRNGGAGNNLLLNIQKHQIVNRNFWISLKSSMRYQSNGILKETPEAKLYDYDAIKKVVALNKDKLGDKILVDVREPEELKTFGKIPTAINIPYKSSPGALDLPEEEFKDRFGFDKPSVDKELIFYCQGGVRSTLAEELASTFGYKKRGNYVGSWNDWNKHEGEHKESEPESK
ncbi:hypothetical protein PACTADRAFT_51881 [Pachysolen tannophilus NRRL Y-2460]|uniref:Rhodanese domain-containing protein n=1 Tax=Pachysolen tannophilus NRRL Y-2460 TaxID=669874 RepID=A0A1E4TNL2_PACTA|nr:hypothetical protein PACTADRAFT_51881 [Pachysolen tannophilus NRRL Y-2460]